MSVAELRACAEEARDWLFNAAAPLWSTRGVLADGMFAEKLTLQGETVHLPRRIRVQARQIYSFCEAGRLGWQGPWRGAVEPALEQLLKRGRREDGFFVHVFDDEGQVSDRRADLYDHAFVLFALAHASRALGRPTLAALTGEIMDVIDARWKHPNGGYKEGEVDPFPPRRQNPHMHLFEAALSLYEITKEERWHTLAQSLFELFSAIFLDKGSGALREYFTLDWRLATEPKLRFVEPGHCFEWAWLVHRFPGADFALADKMLAFARTNGIDPARGIAFYSVELDGAPRDRSARLWAQTERLKAALARFRRTSEIGEATEAVLAYRGLAKYFETPVRGTWRDRMRPDGSFVEEDAPASSFYHIICALSELIETAGA
ncbi:MAG: AGE family epimerase/isomerase [Alphaproteobacteria bacterium]